MKQSELELAFNALQHNFFEELAKANTEDALEKLRISYLSRQGLISNLMSQLKDLSLEKKRIFGPRLNIFKEDALNQFNLHQEKLIKQKLMHQELLKKNFDVTAYKVEQPIGSLHPYTPVIERIEDIFLSMGFEMASGPEVETEFNNFDALNIPADHPARDMWDTFWLNFPHLLMRTHTSNIQARVMQNNTPPIAVFAHGRCYRHEATDASHDIMFMQSEGLLIDKDISMSNLFAISKTFLEKLFDKRDLNLRIRPGYFPFVEPGVEFDISCPFCKHGCSVCKKTGWLELAGAGLVHPNVLKFCGIDNNKYSGFAFGFGLTRLVMLMYGISDIRLLSSGRIDFFKQF